MKTELAAERPLDGRLPKQTRRKFTAMSIHAPACWYALAEFSSQPTDSVQHGIAAFVGDHTTEEGLDLLLAYIVEGSHSTAALAVAQRLVHVLADEAFDLYRTTHALTAAPTAVKA